jgi:hypothetical protein
MNDSGERILQELAGKYAESHCILQENTGSCQNPPEKIRKISGQNTASNFLVFSVASRPFPTVSRSHGKIQITNHLFKLSFGPHQLFSLKVLSVQKLSTLKILRGAHFYDFIVVQISTLFYRFFCCLSDWVPRSKRTDRIRPEFNGNHRIMEAVFRCEIWSDFSGDFRLTSELFRWENGPKSPENPKTFRPGILLP